MIKLFLTTLARQLWRNRLYTFLNILGLSVCISVAWIIFRMTDYEYSYDRKIPEVERIYQVISRDKPDDQDETGGFAGVSRPIFNVLKNEIPGAEQTVPMFYQNYHHAVIQGKENEQVRPAKNGEETDIAVVGTTEDYFNVFPHTFIAGNARNALDAPDKVVLTDTRAREYFPALRPAEVIGKTITYNDSLVHRVSAVIAAYDFPNSFETNQEFIPIKKKDLADDLWGGKSSMDLIFIKPAQGASVPEILAKLNKVNTEHNKESFEKYKYKSWYEVIPVTEKHFETGYEAQTRTADKKVLNGLMITAAFLLLLACINYINLSTSPAPAESQRNRDKENAGQLQKRADRPVYCGNHGGDLPGSR
ncbi:MAG: ABC transporter permease, partial [Leadbetterella sp.]|nr:ABC transporter permease [Leadbetterella sp.]